MRVAVAGSSGLVGSVLMSALADRGHDAVAMVRREAATGEIRWDPATRVLDPSALEGIDTVVNLAGQGIAESRWSERQKREILDSRVAGNTLLSRTIASLSKGPSSLVVGSAIGFYGETGNTASTESSPAGNDFLASVCAALEGATVAAAESGCRVVHARTGIVLSPNGGALGQVLPFFRLGVGGRIGDGQQYWSWISIADEVKALTHLVESQLSGPVNLVAPSAVTNAVFTKTLGRVLRRPTILPTPKLALWARLGRELTEALLYTSTRVVPDRLLADGFEFDDLELESALRSMLDRSV